MRKHAGMRPQDIIVLLKIILKAEPYMNKDLANELFISASEITESLNRSLIAGLLSKDKKRVNKTSLLEFIEHGLPYVFPVVPAGMTNGVLTAHSHPKINASFISDEKYVWPDGRGEFRGFAIEPIYKEVIKAAKSDDDLYKMLALLDMIRIGKVREVKYAVKELKKQITNES